MHLKGDTTHVPIQKIKEKNITDLGKVTRPEPTQVNREQSSYFYIKF